MKIFLYAKCSDCCSIRIEDDNGNDLYDKDGYVPEFLSIQQWGDYVDLEIDNETGKILNWKPIEVSDFKKDEDDE